MYAWTLRTILALALMVPAIGFAQFTHTEEGWKKNDVYFTQLFCVSQEAAKMFADSFMEREPDPEMTAGDFPAGCFQSPQPVPFVLTDKVYESVDFEFERFAIWEAREMYRQKIYVFLYPRPALPIPNIFQAI